MQTSTVEESSSSVSSNSVALYRDALVSVFRFLPLSDLARALRVCTQWRAAEPFTPALTNVVSPRCGVPRLLASALRRHVGTLVLTNSESSAAAIQSLHAGLPSLTSLSLCMPRTANSGGFRFRPPASRVPAPSTHDERAAVHKLAEALRPLMSRLRHLHVTPRTDFETMQMITEGVAEPLLEQIPLPYGIDEALCAAMARYRHLTELRLSDGIRADPALLFGHLPRLKIFHIDSKSRDHTPVDALISAVALCPELVELGIYHRDLTDEHLCALMPSLPLLADVTIWGTEQLRSVEFLRTPHLARTLQRVNLRCPGVTLVLLDALRVLRELRDLRLETHRSSDALSHFRPGSVNFLCAAFPNLAEFEHAAASQHWTTDETRNEPPYDPAAYVAPAVAPSLTSVPPPPLPPQPSPPVVSQSLQMTPAIVAALPARSLPRHPFGSLLFADGIRSILATLDFRSYTRASSVNRSWHSAVVTGAQRRVGVTLAENQTLDDLPLLQANPPARLTRGVTSLQLGRMKAVSYRSSSAQMQFDAEPADWLDRVQLATIAATMPNLLELKCGVHMPRDEDDGGRQKLAFPPSLQCLFVQTQHEPESPHDGAEMIGAVAALDTLESFSWQTGPSNTDALARVDVAPLTALKRLRYLSLQGAAFYSLPNPQVVALLSMSNSGALSVLDCEFVLLSFIFFEVVGAVPEPAQVFQIGELPCLANHSRSLSFSTTGILLARFPNLRRLEPSSCSWYATGLAADPALTLSRLHEFRSLEAFALRTLEHSPRLSQMMACIDTCVGLRELTLGNLRFDGDAADALSRTLAALPLLTRLTLEKGVSLHSFAFLSAAPQLQALTMQSCLKITGTSPYAMLLASGAPVFAKHALVPVAPFASCCLADFACLGNLRTIIVLDTVKSPAADLLDALRYPSATFPHLTHCDVGAAKFDRRPARQAGDCEALAELEFMQM